jgi:hypothetical protein
VERSSLAPACRAEAMPRPGSCQPEPTSLVAPSAKTSLRRWGDRHDADTGVALIALFMNNLLLGLLLGVVMLVGFPFYLVARRLRGRHADGED